MIIFSACPQLGHFNILISLICVKSGFAILQFSAVNITVNGNFFPHSWNSLPILSSSPRWRRRSCGGVADSRFVGGVDHGEMSIKIFTALDYQSAKLWRVIKQYAARLIQFYLELKIFGDCSFCVDRLPVAGQVTLWLARLVRLAGRLPSLYTCAMLCFSTGPSFKITDTAMSWVPPHLLQRAKRLYLAVKSVVVGGMPSFSCMMARIVRFFGDSVKDNESTILATPPTVFTHSW